MGRPGRLTKSYSHKPAKASTTCLQWWKKTLDGWKYIPCPMSLLGILSWALKGKPSGDMTPQRELLDAGAHFWNIIDTWAKECSIEWVYHIPYHEPASRKTEEYNGLLNTTLGPVGGGTFKHWDTHLAKGTSLVNTRAFASQAGLAQTRLLCTAERDRIPEVHIKNMLRKTIWGVFALVKGKPVHGIASVQAPVCTWWVM